MQTGILVATVLAALLTACAHVPSSKSPAAAPITVSFDYSGAEVMLRALKQSELTAGEIDELLRNRAVDAMIRKTIVWVPELRREDFVPYLEEVLAGKAKFSAFNLADIADQETVIRTLMQTLKEREKEMRSRMAARLERYSPLTTPTRIEVFFLVGGSSDGFVLDDDPRLAFFVAIDKASGDADGVEQNMTHELYHVMQKASALRSPQAAHYGRTIETKPPVEQLLMTTLLEGTANFVADARETAGSGPYVSMWRDRYLRNAAPGRMDENFQTFDRALTDLDSGRIGWREAYDAGFAGSTDSRFYFVGMEMARALTAAHGPAYFIDLFTRPPVQFFRDYLALPHAGGSRADLSAEARAVIARQPLAW